MRVSLTALAVSLALISPTLAQQSLSENMGRMVGPEGPAASGGGGLVATYQASDATDTADFGTSHTYTGVAIGTASSDRIVNVCVVQSHNAASPVVSTIGGITATSVTSGNGISIYYANVPTGTTANIVITSSQFFGDLAIGVWTISGQSGGASATPTTSANGTNAGAQPITLAQTVPSSGVAFNCAFGDGGGGTATVTWSGTTSTGGDAVAQNSGGGAPILGLAHSTASGTVSASSSGGSYSFGGAIAYAAWGP